MSYPLRLPEYWTAAEIDFLLHFANELNNAILDQYGELLQNYYLEKNRRRASEDITETDHVSDKDHDGS